MGNSRLKTITQDWTLFLDRDGVINEKRDDDYVKNWDEFIFCIDSKKALNKLSKVFDKIFIVTNQRGVGRDLMTIEDLNKIHSEMLLKINQAGGHITDIFCCTHDDINHPDRKPNIGMAKQAQRKYPKINFNKSLMIGDSESDILFGTKLNMLTILISKEKIKGNIQPNFQFRNLFEFSKEFGL